MYVYQQSEKMLWTVGFFRPGGVWEAESDYDNSTEAADRAAYLNGSVKLHDLERRIEQLETQMGQIILEREYIEKEITMNRRLKIKAVPCSTRDLKPGDLFSTAGPGYWEFFDPLSIGEKVYIYTGLTEAEAPEAGWDDQIYRIEITRLKDKGNEKPTQTPTPKTPTL